MLGHILNELDSVVLEDTLKLILCFVSKGRVSSKTTESSSFIGKFCGSSSLITFYILFGSVIFFSGNPLKAFEE